MSDIVNALRKLYATHPVCMQAADEIEKLQADLRSWEITAKRIEEAEQHNAVECQTCEGSGEIFRGVGGPDDPERCHVCNGSGAAPETSPLPSQKLGGENG